MAVATDLNPGTSPMMDLWSCATLACITMGLTVEEALMGITCNAAKALGRTDLGVIRLGACADIVAVRPPPGEPLEPGSLLQYLGGVEVAGVWRDGRALLP